MIDILARGEYLPIPTHLYPLVTFYLPARSPLPDLPPSPPFFLVFSISFLRCRLPVFCETCHISYLVYISPTVVLSAFLLLLVMAVVVVVVVGQYRGQLSEDIKTILGMGYIVGKEYAS